MRHPARNIPQGYRRIKAAGFTYLGILITVAIIGLTSTATIQVGSIAQRRTAEEDLLMIGSEFTAALKSYAKATPEGMRTSPSTIDELLADRRHATIRRHLRKLYADPLTGKPEWGIVRGTDGGIAGIHSLSDATPIKIGNFEPRFQHFTGKTAYKYWVFRLEQ